MLFLRDRAVPAVAFQMGGGGLVLYFPFYKFRISDSPSYLSPSGPPFSVPASLSSPDTCITFSPVQTEQRPLDEKPVSWLSLDSA